MALVIYRPMFVISAIVNTGRYFTKAIKAKMKTKHISGIRYAYSVTTKWVSIEKY